MAFIFAFHCKMSSLSNLVKKTCLKCTTEMKKDPTDFFLGQYPVANETQTSTSKKKKNISIA